MTPCEKLYKHEFYLNKKLWRMLPQKEKQALISLRIPNDLIWALAREIYFISSEESKQKKKLKCQDLNIP
jgi:hypothetical protein